MSLASRLFMGILNFTDRSLTPSSLKTFRSYQVNSINTFYISGFLIDKIDKVPTFNLSDFNKLESSKVGDELKKLMAFFQENNYIHLGNLQTYASLTLLEDYKAVKNKIKISKSQQLQNIEYDLLQVFSPKVISQTSDYGSIVNSIFSYYECYLIHSKSAVYDINGQLVDLYNPVLYLEKFSNCKMDKFQFTKLFNSFFATFNYGLASIEGFFFTKIDGVLYNQSIHAHYTFDIIDLLNEKQMNEHVINAFKMNPNKIQEIELLHESYKKIGNSFMSIGDLFILIENYIRVDCYSKFDCSLTFEMEEKIADYLRFIRNYELRLLCFFSILNIGYTEITTSINQLDFCCVQIKKHNPLLIPTFGVD
jgi:hypothetical protein